MVRVGVEATLVEDSVDHRELAEGNAVARLELRAIARDGHHPFVVRRKEHRSFEAFCVFEQVLNEAALIVERVRTRVALCDGARRLAKTPGIGIERDDFDSVRRERARDGETGDVAIEDEGAREGLRRGQGRGRGRK